MYKRIHRDDVYKKHKRRKGRIFEHLGEIVLGDFLFITEPHCKDEGSMGGVRIRPGAYDVYHFTCNTASPEDTGYVICVKGTIPEGLVFTGVERYYAFLPANGLMSFKDINAHAAQKLHWDESYNEILKDTDGKHCVLYDSQVVFRHSGGEGSFSIDVVSDEGFLGIAFMVQEINTHNKHPELYDLL